MRALFFGSLGTLAETSELHRHCYNEAFAKHGLGWVWSRDQYRGLLRQSGGQRRIILQAQMTETEVDARAIYATKSELYYKALSETRVPLRPGVARVLNEMQARGVSLGLVTTTPRLDAVRLMDAVGLHDARFQIIVTEDDIPSGKPAPDCYQYAAAMLGIPPGHCVAIECSTDGTRAALAAGMECLAWPGANTADHDYDGARCITGDLLESIRQDAAIAAE